MTEKNQIWHLPATHLAIPDDSGFAKASIMLQRETSPMKTTCKSRLLFTLTALSLALVTTQVAAQTAGEKLSQCLVLKTNGVDRVELVRWMMFAFTAHPSLSAEMSISPTKMQDANQKLAALFTDLITVRCKDEARAAFGEDKSGKTFENAFEALGQVSAQELFNNGQVKKQLGDFSNFLDLPKIQDTLR